MTTIVTPAKWAENYENEHSYVVGHEGRINLVTLASSAKYVYINDYSDAKSASAGGLVGRQSTVVLPFDGILQVLDKLGYAVAKKGEGLDLRSATDQELLDVAGAASGTVNQPLAASAVKELRTRSNLPVLS